MSLESRDFFKYSSYCNGLEEDSGEPALQGKGEDGGEWAAWRSFYGGSHDGLSSQDVAPVDAQRRAGMMANTRFKGSLALGGMTKHSAVIRNIRLV